MKTKIISIYASMAFVIISLFFNDLLGIKIILIAIAILLIENSISNLENETKGGNHG